MGNERRPPHEIGAENLGKVKDLLGQYPGIFRREIAERLNLSEMAVGRHLAKIRAEWGVQKGKAR
jgi:predicted ArsR family transcriptional regulator